MHDTSKLVTPKELSKLWNVSEQTLRQWNNEGKLRAITTDGGHRRYIVDVNQRHQQSSKKNYIYARVSSRKQESDLERQVEMLKAKYPNYEIVTDVASGINFKRKGLRKLLELLFNGVVNEVVVAHKDRFSRFGFELFEWIFQQHGAVLRIIQDDDKDREPESELADDIMSIITVFSARYYGRRKYANDL
jgi:putative resolvase